MQGGCDGLAHPAGDAVGPEGTAGAFADAGLYGWSEVTQTFSVPPAAELAGPDYSDSEEEEDPRQTLPVLDYVLGEAAEEAAAALPWRPGG